MNDLLEIHDPGIKCNTFLHEDGKTLMHFGLFPNEAACKLFQELGSFEQFHEELKASVPEVAPKAENLTLIPFIYDFFG